MTRPTLVGKTVRRGGESERLLVSGYPTVLPDLWCPVTRGGTEGWIPFSRISSPHIGREGSTIQWLSDTLPPVHRTGKTRSQRSVHFNLTTCFVASRGEEESRPDMRSQSIRVNRHESGRAQRGKEISRPEGPYRTSGKLFKAESLSKSVNHPVLGPRQQPFRSLSRTDVRSCPSGTWPLSTNVLSSRVSPVVYRVTRLDPFRLWLKGIPLLS